MKKAPIATNENERLLTLKSYNILDTQEEKQFDEITKAAAKICNCKTALVSLVDSDRQWFKSKIGLDVNQTPREISFCGHAIMSDELFIVEDSHQDERFKDNPLVQNSPHIRFYAGAPLIAPNGHRIGTLCVLDSQAKNLSSEQKIILKVLAGQVISYLELKKKTEELKLSKKHRNIILNNMLDGVVLQEKPGTIIDFNPAALKILGLSKDQLLGRDSMDPRWKSIKSDGSVFPGEEHPAMVTLNTGKTQKDVIMGVEAPGIGRRWIKINSVPIKEDEEDIKALTTFQDTTELIQKRIALEESEQKLRQIFNQSHDAIITTDPKTTRFTSCNPATLKLFKVSSEDEFIKLRPQDISPKLQANAEASDELIKKYVAQAMEKGIAFFEWQYIDTDGNEIPCTVLLSKIQEKNESYIHGVIRDISKQKKLENQLIETNQYLDLSLESAGLGVWDWCLTDNSVKFDKRWASMLGYELSEIKMELSTWKDKVHPDDIDKCYQDIQNYMDGKSEIYENVHRMKHKNGNWIYILDRGRFSKWDNEGKPIRFAGIHLDITDRIKAEQEYEKQKIIAHHQAKLASLGELAAGVGHEINNPLSIIKGYITVLDRKAQKNNQLSYEELTLYTAKIDTAINRISSIVNGLRTFSRSDYADFSDFDPVEAVNESFDMINEIYTKNGIQIVYNNQCKDNILLSGNRGKMQQVLMNLLSNAKDAISEQDDKKIEITLRQLENNLEIRIQDNGPGIPKDIQDKIFDPFFTTKEVNKGTGIGLSLVHNFIKEMKGDVVIDNGAQGAVFIIHLPIKVNTQDTTIQSPTETQAKGMNAENFKASVIVADDEEDIRELLVMILKDLGIEVVCAENGKIALDTYTKNPDKFDLIISDMKMPIMDGESLLKELRSNKAIKQPKFIFITGGTNLDFEDKELEINQLSDGYILKPFNEEKITQILSETMGDNLN